MIKKIIKEVLKVAPVDEETQKWRYDICKSCEHFSGFDNEHENQNDKCGICKCYMEIKTGLKYNRNPKKGFRMEETHCPMGKWNDTAIANLYRERDGEELLNT